MGIWEVVDEVAPIVLYQTLGIYYICLYCYAMLVDVIWFEKIHERCERYC